MVDETPVSLLTDFATKLKDIEEKLNLLKERLLLVNRTFLKERERFDSEIFALKESVRLVKDDLEKIREGLEHIIKESAGFARREELNLLQRYMRLWEPLKFVKEEEVKSMIDETLKKGREVKRKK